MQYGNPFEDARTQLENVASSSHVELLIISQFYLNQLIGNLSHSIDKSGQGKTNGDLIDLCDRLETVQRYGDGELDVW